ncbi:Kazal-type serine protease inhibitor family protein [Hoeflea olei]|uniref:Kazal-like domain-containing protein n=1 Tax=Hoeflea olei TaxID=1480615 RepID=A0A1C1YQ83_9HYPH|nr:Kazal-type serine protease inhibitor [Hoeflea olei]OCW55682.1 hypothetical protein AWJ14_14425 [Hoeflea olei]
MAETAAHVPGRASSFGRLVRTLSAGLTSRFALALLAATLILGGGEVAQAGGSNGTGSYQVAQACPMIYQPVCATRGGNVRTFPNACEARRDGWRVVNDSQCARFGRDGDRRDRDGWRRDDRRGHDRWDRHDRRGHDRWDRYDRRDRWDRDDRRGRDGWNRDDRRDSPQWDRGRGRDRDRGRDGHRGRDGLGREDRGGDERQPEPDPGPRHKLPRERR